MAIPVLDATLLDAFEQRLRGQGLPVDEWGAAGLSDDQMLSTLEPLGLVMPTEGRAWWAWRDGGAGPGHEYLIGPHCVGFLSLSEAVRTARDTCADVKDGRRAGPARAARRSRALVELVLATSCRAAESGRDRV